MSYLADFIGGVCAVIACITGQAESGDSANANDSFRHDWPLWGVYILAVFVTILEVRDFKSVTLAL